MSRLSGLTAAGVVGAVFVFNIATGKEAAAQTIAPKLPKIERMVKIFQGHDFVCDQSDTIALQVHVDFSVSLDDTRDHGLTPREAGAKINPFIRSLRRTWLEAWQQAAKDHAFNVSHENDRNTPAVLQAQAVIDTATKDIEAKTGITVEVATVVDGHSTRIIGGCSNTRLPGFENIPIVR